MGGMRIVFAGTPEFAVPSLRALVDAGHDVVGVITREDAPVGRKRVLTPSPVAQAAESLNLPLHRTNRLGDAATAWVRSLDAELGVIVAYGGLVRDPLLSLPQHGWVNLHFSALPRWRGAAPVQRALMAGEQQLGVTVFRLVEALDAGDILTEAALEFPPGTPAGVALTELASFGTAALREAIRLIAHDPQAGTPQHGNASYAHKLTRDDARLDLARSTNEVLAHWAGVTPEPGAWVLCDGAPLKLHELRKLPVSHAAADREAGRAAMREGRAVLELSDGLLELTRVQPAGKATMDGAAWLRGRGGSAVLG